VSAILEFLAMGGYAAYVWPAFGTAALVLAVLLWNSVARLRSRQAMLKALEGNAPRRRERGDEA
jgi:heme exporter protein D